jgi:hypothetical protein
MVVGPASGNVWEEGHTKGVFALDLQPSAVQLAPPSVLLSAEVLVLLEPAVAALEREAALALERTPADHG